MKYAVEMGSGAMVYIPSYIKIGSSVQKLIGGSQPGWRSHKPTLGTYKHTCTHTEKAYIHTSHQTKLHHVISLYTTLHNVTPRDIIIHIKSFLQLHNRSINKRNVTLIFILHYKQRQNIITTGNPNFKVTFPVS
jgi:hypothetical protein